MIINYLRLNLHAEGLLFDTLQKQFSRIGVRGVVLR
jgi:hypothetical protein